MIDGAVTMTESVAICHYLVERYGPSPLALAVSDADYGLWLDWLYRGEATLTFPLTLLLRYGELELAERRLPQVCDDYAQWFLSRLRHVTRALGDREWSCGGRFTLADVSVGYALLFARTLGLDAKFSPPVIAYWEALSARPAFVAAQRQQAAMSIGQLP
jgi:glutathione S-transferase